MSFNFHHFCRGWHFCAVYVLSFFSKRKISLTSLKLTKTLGSNMKHLQGDEAFCLLICLRNTFTMHVEAGHYNNMPEDLAKDLRCPLCLYHTKRKSNMIDHIVLHRGTLPSKWNRPHSMLSCFFFTSQLYRWVMLWETAF